MGTEERLIDCPANPVGTTDCSHFEDRVVECLDGKWVEKILAAFIQVFTQCISSVSLYAC